MSRILTANQLVKLLNNFLEIVPPHTQNLKASLSSYSKKDNKLSRKTFNTPHPPKDPPENYNCSHVDHEAFDVPDYIPATVFRQFTSDSEKLGPGADKRCCYKNPEYYSYHRYSFVALQMACLAIREHRAKHGNTRCLYDIENSDGEDCSSDEDNK